MLKNNRKNAVVAKIIVPAPVTPEIQVVTPEILATPEIQAVEPKVTIKYVITQCGKNPFSLIHETTAKLKDVTVLGLARKTGYAIADSLFTHASNAMNAKAKHGGYITSFRPKAVFKIEVVVNNVSCFHALETKGLDAIRLMNGKGQVYSRMLLVDKFELIASAVKSSQSLAQMLDFEAETLANAQEPELLNA